MENMHCWLFTKENLNRDWVGEMGNNSAKIFANSSFNGNTVQYFHQRILKKDKKFVVKTISIILKFYLNQGIKGFSLTWSLKQNSLNIWNCAWARWIAWFLTSWTFLESRGNSADDVIFHPMWKTGLSVLSVEPFWHISDAVLNFLQIIPHFRPLQTSNCF